MIYGNVEIIMRTEQNSKGKLYFRVYARGITSHQILKGSNYTTKFRVLAFHHFKKLLRQNKAR